MPKKKSQMITLRRSRKRLLINSKFAIPTAKVVPKFHPRQSFDEKTKPFGATINTILSLSNPKTISKISRTEFQASYELG